MGIDRRLALAVAAAVALGVAVDLPRAQNLSGFDPAATARLRAGEIAREIAASGRDASVPEPSRDDVFNTGLLLQAGLRALLPVRERQGIALPGTPSPSDPSELTVAQENYKTVFESGADAIPAQKATAIKSIELAAQHSKGGLHAPGRESDGLVGASVNRIEPCGLL
jgi:hypothetical protein